MKNCSQYNISNEEKIFNPYTNKKAKPQEPVEIDPLIRDSDLKLNSNITKLTRIPMHFDEDTELKRGIYKLVYRIPEVVNEQHITNVVKAVKVEDEFKDIFFYKIDIKDDEDENAQGSIVTAIFEIPVNTISIAFIVYVIGASIIGVVSTYTMTSAVRLVDVVGDVLPWVVGGLIVYGVLIQK